MQETLLVCNLISINHHTSVEILSGEPPLIMVLCDINRMALSEKTPLADWRKSFGGVGQTSWALPHSTLKKVSWHARATANTGAAAYNVHKYSVHCFLGWYTFFFLVFIVSLNNSFLWWFGHRTSCEASPRPQWLAEAGAWGRAQPYWLQDCQDYHPGGRLLFLCLNMMFYTGLSKLVIDSLQIPLINSRIEAVLEAFPEKIFPLLMHH